VGVRANAMQKSLEHFNEQIVWYLWHYKNFTLIILETDKETILDRANGREEVTTSDNKLIDDIVNHNGEYIYEANKRNNRALWQYIENLIAEWVVQWRVLYVST
jgi:hypothetical protein